MKRTIAIAALAACLATGAAAHPEDDDFSKVCMDGSLIGFAGKYCASNNLGAAFIRCTNATPFITGWVCGVKYPALINRDFHHVAD